MFFYRKNLSAHEMRPMPKPWDFKSKAPYDTMSKAEFTEWSLTASTDHAFVTLCEGGTSSLQISSDNEVHLIHGLMVDYDGMVADDPVAAVLKKFKGGYLPSWIVRSRGKEAHVVWLFDKPMAVMGSLHGKKFLEYVGRKVQAVKMFGGLDRASYEPNMTFEIGREWLPVPGSQPLPSSLLWVWDHDVLQAMRVRGFKRGPELPIEKIAEEIERRWPGIVPQVKIGAMCNRFWDPISDNMTGCQIAPDGVRVYVTGPNGIKDAPFKSWTQILGSEFVDGCRAEKMTDALGDCYYDEDLNLYWKLSEDKRRFERWRDQQIGVLLKSMGYAPKAKGLETCSEVERMKLDIQLKQRAARAEQRLFFPPGLITMSNGERIINTSMVKPVAPCRTVFNDSDEAPPWLSPVTAAAFPFSHAVLTSLFQDPYNYDAPLDPQLEYLLSWLSYFYRTAADLSPSVGQALFLCGGADVGKTFTSRIIMGSLLGGYAEVGKYFLQGEAWTQEMQTHGILAMDDDVSHATYNARQAFQTRVKAYVANGTIMSNAKYKSTYTVELMARLVVTLNDDSLVSRSVLPPLDVDGVKDKVSYLLLPKATWARPISARNKSREDNNRQVRMESPALARWLSMHDIPDHLRDPRFGTKSFLHPVLSSSAMIQNGYATELMEAIDNSFGGSAAEEFHGTASQLHNVLSASHPHIARHVTPRIISTTLQSLAKSGGFDIEIEERQGSKMTHYRFKGNVFSK